MTATNMCSNFVGNGPVPPLNTGELPDACSNFDMKWAGIGLYNLDYFCLAAPVCDGEGENSIIWS